MAVSKFDFATGFAREANSANARLAKARSSVWVGKVCDNDGRPNSYLTKCYNGARIEENSVFRVAYDYSNQCFILCSAKAPYILEGRLNAHERSSPTEQNARDMYLISAYPYPRNPSQNLILPGEIALAMNVDKNAYISDLRERVKNHLTLNEAGNFSTTGRHYYEKIKNKNGSYDVHFTISTRRKVESGKSSLRTIAPDDGKWLNKASTVIASGVSHGRAVHEIAKHRQAFTKKIWDHGPILEGENLPLQSKDLIYKFLNMYRDNPVAMFRSAAIGAGFGAVSAASGGDKSFEIALSAGGLTGVAHAVFDIWGEAPVRNLLDVRAAKTKATSSYDSLENSVHFYTEKTVGHINRVCKKLSKEFSVVSNELQSLEWMDALSLDINPLDAVFLNLDEMVHMRKDNDLIEHGLQPRNIRGLVTSVDLKGFSSIASFPGHNMRVSAVMDELMILKHLPVDIKKYGNIRTEYCRHRADICMDTAVRLPEHYKEQIGDKIIKYEIDPRTSGFPNSFVTDVGVSLDEMMDDTGKKLKRDQPNMDSAVFERSMQFTEESFTLPSNRQYDYMQETAPDAQGYMGFVAPKRPHSKALKL
jgi:hypothetical protein